MRLTSDQADILALQCLAVRAAQAAGVNRRELRAMQYLIDVTMETLADTEFELAEMRAKVNARMASLATGETKGAA
jgi:hypothetical protein